jgi:hypothetical protein
VSHARAGRALLFVAPLGVAIGAACERSADLRDETPGGIDVGPTLDAGDIPDIDAGLGGDAHTPCARRAADPGCVGPVDFPCSFDIWVQQIAADCRAATDCTANGWLEVTMGEEGCVTSIGMNQPSQPMIDCVVEAVGEVRCPCPSGVETVYFGEGNSGCEDE